MSLEQGPSSSSSSGIGFFGLLTILFIALKLTNFIQWPWWLVLLPAYGPLSLVVVVVAVLVAIHVATKD